jgi:DnaJ-class molecular chaperone
MPYTLEKDEIIKLVNGKFQTRKCTYCDGKGYIYEEDAKYQCENCQGLGFNLKLDEEEG